MRKMTSYLLAAIILSGLYVSGRYNFLLFHSLAELFAIVIACGIFMIAWNTRRFLQNHGLLFLGIAYLFIGSLDLLHMLAYKGMRLFQVDDGNIASQLWIAARYLESLSLMVTPFVLRRRLKTWAVFSGYGAISIIVLFSIFQWNIFPDCFLENAGGLTVFKIISEYIIAAILLASLLFFLKRRDELDPRVLRWMIWSIVFTVASELAFTMYAHAYSFSNLLGHYFKIVSFYFIYKAIIETGLTNPFDLLFFELKRNQEKFRSLFTHMINAFAYHKMIFDEHGRATDYVFLEVNPAFEFMTGLKKEELIGRSVTQILPGIRQDSTDWIAIYGKVAARGQPVRFEAYMPVLQRWYAIIAYCPEKDHFVTVFEDISDRKRTEEALQSAHRDLETKVIERTADLSRTVEALRAENDRRLRAEKNLRDLSRKSIEALESERRTVAKELHDSIGASLAAIKFVLEEILSQMGRSQSPLAPSLEKAIFYLVDTIKETKRISANLRPATLEELGLIATINDYVRRFSDLYKGIRIDWHIEVREEEIPDELKIVIYRILQEALNNIGKHSQADSVTLNLRAPQGRIELEMTDNGIGFDMRAVSDHKTSLSGFGLQSMRERAEITGGAFALESNPREGTRLLVSFPLPVHCN